MELKIEKSDTESDNEYSDEVLSDFDFKRMWLVNSTYQGIKMDRMGKSEIESKIVPFIWAD